MTAAATPSACGVEISLRIGQRVRHRDYSGKRVTGVVNSLQIESEQGLTASVILDAPIIIAPTQEGDREIRIHWQTAPVTEFTPFDDRDEQIAELLAALTDTWDVINAAGLPNLARGVELGSTVWFVKASDAQSLAKAAIARVTGNAS